MLTNNLNCGIGLCNGSMCKIYDFVLNSDQEVEYILVECDENYSGPSDFLKNGIKNIVPIKMFTASYGPKKGP
jgi:hypothetical protein